MLKLSHRNVSNSSRNVLSGNAVVLISRADTAAAVASTLLTYSTDHTFTMDPPMSTYIHHIITNILVTIHNNINNNNILISGADTAAAIASTLLTHSTNHTFSMDPPMSTYIDHEHFKKLLKAHLFD